MESSCRLAHLSVCVFVSVCLCGGQKVFCGKTADWIRMLFGMVSGVSRGMGVLDGVMIIEEEGAVLEWIWGIPL